ncbi:MAG: lamin tail domain-containing protein [Verrucomicrobiales bacterium]|nr:lamin tail domain-containing protein [Verrucomicrobiales bacterium]
MKFKPFILLVALCLGLIAILPTSTAQAAFAPTEVGKVVNGVQDDFTGSTLRTNWLVRGRNVFSVSDGMLHVGSATGDPNHLLYERVTYHNTIQEVLARIRVTRFDSGDGPRAGIATSVSVGSSQGINLHFRDEPAPGDRHVEFLDDTRAWASEFPIPWQNDAWYWLRLRHEPNAASLGGTNDIFGKIWKADGTEPEPANWQLTANYTPMRSARAGFAGISAGSLGSTSEFDVDYILIKASGLPSITVSPAIFIELPVAITRQPQPLTVTEGSPLLLAFGWTGNPTPNFQWFRNGVPVPDATNASFSVPAARLTDAGTFSVQLQNVVTNIPHSATSESAAVQVLPDTLPPSLRDLRSLSADQLLVRFSERVLPSSASDPTRYAIESTGNPVRIDSASLDSSGSNVVLRVQSLVEGATYRLLVNGIRDTSVAANTILPSTAQQFTVSFYEPAAVGEAQPIGGSVAVPGGINITGGGLDIGGGSDQFQFSHQIRTGDFDVQVRVESLTPTDVWSEAGLLARETLAPGSRFAGTLATPSISGAYFQYRATNNGVAGTLGSFPVNYPKTWLRLKREGNAFTGFAGWDGQHWRTLGRTNLSLPQSLYLGFAASSHRTNQTTTAAFRDFSNVTSASTAPLTSSVEPLGQSSRRTSLVISEIMYHPADRADGRNLEFVELFNAHDIPQDISGWRLDGAADYVFPIGTILAPGTFLVVAASPADLSAVTGLNGVLGPFSNTNALPNSEGVIQLRNQMGAVFLEAHYSSESPWPVAADGAGHSLVLARPSYGEREVEAWAASDQVGGSPGSQESVTVDPLDHVVINEYLANPGPDRTDFVELYNHSSVAVDISGCLLSDAAHTNKFKVPFPTVLPPRGFVAFHQASLGFALSSAGETLYLRNPSGTRVLDAVRFEAQAHGVSSGRQPDGAPRFTELAFPTPAENNTPPYPRSVVINEIMYHPISGENDDQYVELYNLGSNTVSLAEWQLSGGIRYTFPAEASVAPNSYVVVTRSIERMLARYPALSSNQVYGDFQGSLSRRGERIALSMALPLFSTNNAVVTTQMGQVLVDEVSYRDGGHWGQWSDGGGSSLELKDPRSDNRLAANWADSDETKKAPWTSVEVRGVLDNGTSSADRFHTLLQGRGECLIDNVEVRTVAGVNVLTNSTFETSAAGWTAEGTQSASSWEPTEGFNSSGSYHVRAVDRGDNQVNRIRARIAPTQLPNRTNTILAKVRWLRGHPEILFRLSGNWLEAAVRMDLPTNLGTPGARNSQTVANSGPAISEVTHNPPVPAAGESVVVTARVHDPDDVTAVELRYRIDPSTNIVSIPMTDDGSGGDSVAGDGLYAATLPGQPLNALIAFHVWTTDDALPRASATFPPDAPKHEGLVRFGETLPPGNLPSYRFWMTRAAFTAWDTRNNLNNTLNDVTFVLGNHRVIYNAGATYAGSPYIGPSFDTPTGRLCGYTVEFPSDQPFLGDTALVLDWPGGHGNETTGIQEQMAYWIAQRMNLAYSHRYFIRLTVNGVTDMQRGGVFEAALQPAAEFLEQWSPGDSEGDFFKIDRAFEFDDGGNRVADPEPQLRIYRTPDLVNGGFKKKTETYRWYWMKRSFESANDYTNLFVAADILNATGPEPYTSQTEALIDVDQWMGIFAVEHIINNFDSWGHDIGKNMYMFKPQNGRWQIYMFDLDWLMLVAAGSYPPQSGPLFIADDPTVTRMYGHPPFRRAYLRAVQTAVDAAFDPSQYEPVMDAKYASLVANGVNRVDGQPLDNPAALKTWFRQRRTFLVSQLSPAAASFAILNNGGRDFTTNGAFATLVGTAPLSVRGIRVDGVDAPIRWTTLTNWSIRVPLAPGTNQLSLAAYDLAGQALPQLSDSIKVVSSAALQSAVGSVVINEIMYHPARANAEYVEIYNRSATSAFAIGGWRLDGIDFTFPEGTVLDKNSFVVVAKNRDDFARTYGGAIALAGLFTGEFDRTGGTLALVAPGDSPSQDVVIDQVTYESTAPWPLQASGTGRSIQLVDASRDNSRVANWSDGSALVPARLPTPGTTNSVARALPEFPTIWLNEVQPHNVAGRRDDAGDNDPWLELYNSGSSAISLKGWHLTDSYTDLTRWAFPTNTILNPGQFLIVWLDAEPEESTPSSPHASFRPSPESGSLALVFPLQGQPAVLDYLNYQGIRADASIGYHPDGQTGPRRSFFFPTPGSANNPSVSALPIFINEWMAANTSFLADPADGLYDDWLELYNPNDVLVDLSSYALSDRPILVDPRYNLPAGTTIPAKGFLLVWADSNPGQNTVNGLDRHTGFRINQEGEGIWLFAPDGSVVDTVQFGLQSDNISEGRWPDGGSDRFFMTRPTPRAANVISDTPPVAPRILSAGVTAQGTFQISWSAEVGKQYRVQYRDALAGGSWIDLPTVQATETTASTLLPVEQQPQRFYRVLRLLP